MNERIMYVEYNIMFKSAGSGTRQLGLNPGSPTCYRVCVCDLGHFT